MENQNLIAVLIDRAAHVGTGEYTSDEDLAFLKALSLALGYYRISSSKPYVREHIDNAEHSLRNAIYHDVGESLEEGAA